MSIRNLQTQARRAYAAQAARTEVRALRLVSDKSVEAPNDLSASEALKRLIDESLEEGLLRFTERQRILAEGRRRGFSDFHTHLLIAQRQHGDQRPLTMGMVETTRKAEERQMAARLAGATILALAIVLTAIRVFAL